MVISVLFPDLFQRYSYSAMYSLQKIQKELDLSSEELNTLISRLGSTVTIYRKGPTGAQIDEEGFRLVEKAIHYTEKGRSIEQAAQYAQQDLYPDYGLHTETSTVKIEELKRRVVALERENHFLRQEMESFNPDLQKASEGRSGNESLFTRFWHTLAG